MKKLMLILAFAANPVASQTVSQIERTYGKPMFAYTVTEHIWMTPDFAADGQVCRMRFHPKRFDRGGVYLEGQLNLPELKWILNHLVPPSARGNRKTSFGMSTLGGGLVTTDYEYERVTFTFVYSEHLKIDPSALKQSEFVDFAVTDLPPLPPPSEYDFDDTPKAEIVMLRWNDRTCAGDYNFTPSDPQKVAEIEHRFGPPQEIYSIGSYGSMSADYAADGQVCQMWLYPRRVSGHNSYLGNNLGSGEVSMLLKSVQPHESVLRKNFSLSIPDSPQSDVKDRTDRTNDPQIVTVQWLRRTCAALP